MVANRSFVPTLCMLSWAIRNFAAVYCWILLLLISCLSKEWDNFTISWWVGTRFHWDWHGHAKRDDGDIEEKTKCRLHRMSPTVPDPRALFDAQEAQHLCTGIMEIISCACKVHCTSAIFLFCPLSHCSWNDNGFFKPSCIPTLWPTLFFTILMIVALS